NMAASSVLLLLVTLLPPQGHSAHQDSGIVNGEKIKTNSKPYMVSVQERNKETEKREHMCGGFLVSDNFVMTAVHCVNLMVVVGAHDISRQESSARKIDVKYYHIHPGYNSKTFQNDIMLLQVHDSGRMHTCQNGATKTGGTANPHLLEVNVTVVDRASCQRSWGNTATITLSMICAGDTAAGYKGVCQGDSDGPLVCKGTAVRVVSFNEKGNCDNLKEPNVYTKVAKYLSWIKCITKY
uniref:trypsin n=1 Tax=Oncorhynchus tshawytscha TaxID=74940 RepID=A0AAZ3R8C3_ONCTS